MGRRRTADPVSRDAVKSLRLRWWAGRDGVSHAHAGGRTVCGAPSLPEPWAWARLADCGACCSVAARLRRGEDVRRVAPEAT